MVTEPAQSSGLKSADTAIHSGPCIYLGAKALGDGTNAATVIIYDNASAASGTVVGKSVVDAGLTEGSDLVCPEGGVYCQNGLYLDIGGTGAEAIVYFRKL
jgi:hypothetical protein